MSKSEGKNSKKDQQKITPQQIEQLAREVAELTEALKRERADTENIRRHHEKQITEFKNVVKSGVVKDLLPVIDNIERALKHVPKDIEKHDYVKGVQGVAKQFEKTLNSIGVERIKTVGEEFSPDVHEAVVMEEGDGNKEIVSEELQSGYKLGDYVIRPAMVKVKSD